MKQQPSADKVYCRSADCKHQLSQQNKPNKANILILDADIHDGLSEERQDKLQEAPDYQAQDDLPEVLAIFLHIPKEKAETYSGLSPRYLFVCLLLHQKLNEDDIMRIMGISPSTVRSIKSRIRKHSV